MTLGFNTLRQSLCKEQECKIMHRFLCQVAKIVLELNIYFFLQKKHSENIENIIPFILLHNSPVLSIFCGEVLGFRYFSSIKTQTAPPKAST